MLRMIATKRCDTANGRARIGELMRLNSPYIKSGTITRISDADLRLMFFFYDQVLFGNWFKDNFEGDLRFSLSRRMTKSAGLTIYPKEAHGVVPGKATIEIRIGVDFLFHYDSLEGNKLVCGIETANSLGALQVVFEHEICHVIEFICFGVSNCRKDRFKSISWNLFGHTESYHDLPTPRQIASKRLGLNIGDPVSFELEGRILRGIINNISKRATVMVKDNKGSFTDEQGNRYAKYYVPLTLLNKS